MTDTHEPNEITMTGANAGTCGICERTVVYIGTVKKGKWQHVLSKTVDGTDIVVGLRVIDYDRKHGKVVDEGQNWGYPGKGDDYWFQVERDDGSVSSMNGERMCAEANYDGVKYR